jgi:hypothetical protein
MTPNRARSARFRHIEELTLKGLRHQEIARELGVNVRTIRRDVEMITKLMFDTLPGEIAAYRAEFCVNWGVSIKRHGKTWRSRAKWVRLRGHILWHVVKF